jgi:23S rRNA (uracil1939-C5)-methyltransferase
VNQAVETWLGELKPGAARIVLDPPRGGLTPRVVGALLRRGAQRLTYVSCHPAALARDLRALSRSYRLERVALLDMFPQSGHVEVVAQLAREDEGERAAR